MSILDSIEEVGSTAVHAGEALGDLVTGDLDGAADQAQKAGESLIDAAVDSPVGSLVHGAVDLGTAVYDGATGDWDGAASHALSMSEDMLDGVTDGAFGIGEEAVTGALHLGGVDMSAHDAILGGLHQAGDALGDAAYNAINGSDSAPADDSSYQQEPAYDYAGE